MITIKGTNKIKGALDLSGINKQLKAGDRVPLTDKDFSDATVQTAIDMGFITYKEGGILKSESNSSSIKLRNIYDREILINSLGDKIRPQQTFTLSEDQVNNADIRGALAKGYLEIVSSAKPGNPIEETNVRVGNIFDADSDSPLVLGDTPRYLETNEEALDPGVIDTPDPKPVEKTDIHDPKKKSVIWNPTNDPIAHAKTQTQMEAISLSKEGKAENIESSVDVSDIKFVDEELDQQRKQSHPILKDKPDNKNDGIDFL